MKKIALTLGAAIVALTALHTTDASAGSKLRFGWGGHHGLNVHFGSPYYFSGGPKYRCRWKKRKIHTPYGWHWKKVRVCKPFYRAY